MSAGEKAEQDEDEKKPQRRLDRAKPAREEKGGSGDSRLEHA